MAIYCMTRSTNRVSCFDLLPAQVSNWIKPRHKVAVDLLLLTRSVAVTVEGSEDHYLICEPCSSVVFGILPPLRSPPNAADTGKIWCTFLLSGLLTAINCYNVKWATRVQDIFTGTKILALLVIIVTGGYVLTTGHIGSFQDPMAGTSVEPGYIALAFYSGLFSYSGWWVCIHVCN